MRIVVRHDIFQTFVVDEVAMKAVEVFDTSNNEQLADHVVSKLEAGTPPGWMTPADASVEFEVFEIDRSPAQTPSGQSAQTRTSGERDV